MFLNDQRGWPHDYYVVIIHSHDRTFKRVMTISLPILRDVEQVMNNHSIRMDTDTVKGEQLNWTTKSNYCKPKPAKPKQGTVLKSLHQLYMVTDSVGRGITVTCLTGKHVGETSVFNSAASFEIVDAVILTDKL